MTKAHQGVTRRTFTRMAGAGVTAALLPGVASRPAAAQATFTPPSQIKMFIPSAPGGPNDLISRLIGDYLQKNHNVTVIPDNRPAGGGIAAMQAAVASKPDGATLVIGNTVTLATLPAVSKNANYDPTRDLTPIAKLIDSFQVFVVRADFPAKTLKEFLDYAKANPGKLRGSATGIGTITHLSQELFKLKTGIQFTSVFHKGGPDAMMTLLGGDAQFAIDATVVVKELVDQGKLRALAVTSTTQQPDYPGVPTMAEAGVPDYVITSFFGVAGPANMPKPIVDYYNKVINAVLETEAGKTTLTRLGGKINPVSAEEFREFATAQFRKWQETAKAANISIE